MKIPKTKTLQSGFMDSENTKKAKKVLSKIKDYRDISKQIKKVISNLQK